MGPCPPLESPFGATDIRASPLLEFSVIMAGKLSWYVTAAAASLLTGIVVFGTITALVWAIFNNFTFSVPILDIAMLVAALPSAASIWFLAGAAYRVEQRLDPL